MQKKAQTEYLAAVHRLPSFFFLVIYDSSKSQLSERLDPSSTTVWARGKLLLKHTTTFGLVRLSIGWKESESLR